MSPLLLDLLARERVARGLAEADREQLVRLALGRARLAPPARSSRGRLAATLRVLALALDPSDVTHSRTDPVLIQP